MLLPSLTTTFKTDNPLNPSVPLPSLYSLHDNSVQFSRCRVQFFAPPWTAACQASLSIINSQSLLKPMSIESVMPFNHLILCRPFLLPPSIFPSIRIFSNESVLHIRWPKYWSFSFNINPSNEYSGLISFRMDWLDLQSKGLSRVFSDTTVHDTHRLKVYYSCIYLITVCFSYYNESSNRGKCLSYLFSA